LNKTNWWTNNIKRIVLKWIYSNVDFAFYVGTLNRQYYQEYGLQNQQLIFAPHAVDNDRFARKVYNQSTALRSELNISKNSKIILFAGKLDVNKNAKLLLKAFLELDLVDTHLIFVGSGVLMKEMKLMSIHHSYVHFTSFKNQTEMPALYQAADLFCLPSLNDSWGLAINEAMAAGTAILVSDQAGAAIDLVQASNGRMFKSNDLSDLKEQLQKLMLNPAFLRTAGIASQKVIKNWNMDLQVTNILRCIQL
jgi:glycosyltransferase involved in cell wall biosynthesis